MVADQSFDAALLGVDLDHKLSSGCVDHFPDAVDRLLDELAALLDLDAHGSEVANVVLGAGALIVVGDNSDVCRVFENFGFADDRLVSNGQLIAIPSEDERH